MQSSIAQTLATIVLVLAVATAHAQTSCVAPDEVVRAGAAALSRNDSERLTALLRADARVFTFPSDPERLVGELSSRIGTDEQRRANLAKLVTAPRTSEILQTIVTKDLVFAKIRMTDGRDSAHSTYLLAVFRIVDCAIADLWPVAQTASDDRTIASQSENVIRDLVVANNAGDVERFLAVFAPSVLHFRSSGDVHAIGDKPSRYNGDPEGRRQAFLKMFANGAPAQVRVLGIMTVGDLIVSHDLATLPDGRVLDEVSIYRIVAGRITHDWFVSVQPRS